MAQKRRASLADEAPQSPKKRRTNHRHGSTCRRRLCYTCAVKFRLIEDGEPYSPTSYQPRRSKRLAAQAVVETTKDAQVADKTEKEQGKKARVIKVVRFVETTNDAQVADKKDGNKEDVAKDGKDVKTTKKAPTKKARVAGKKKGNKGPVAKDGQDVEARGKVELSE